MNDLFLGDSHVFKPKSFSQGARFLKIDLAQLSSQKRFDFRNSYNYPSLTFLGTSYSRIVVAVFQEESFGTPTPLYYKKQNGDI